MADTSAGLIETAPYLSIVAAVCGDDTSDDLGALIQLFLDTWVDQSRRHHLNCELIIVGQGLPALTVPHDSTQCQVRLIEVPGEVQCRPSNARLITNAGIRRARGEFILATSIGAIVSNELMEFLASGRLERGCMYCVDRYDVESGIPAGATLDEALAYCRSHLLRVWTREGIFPLTSAGLRRNAPDDISSLHSGLSFGSGWFPPERYPITNETFRWIDDDAEVLARVPEGGGILILEIEPGPGLVPLPQTVQIFDDHDGNLATAWTVAGRTTTALAVPPAAPGRSRQFRLHIPGGGSPVLDDPRILNLAVFRCDWVQPNLAQSVLPSLLSSIRRNSSVLRRLLGSVRKFRGSLSLLGRGPTLAARAARLLARRGDDIFEGGMDFQLGRGWYYREESAAERFRWVSQDAQLLLRMPVGTSTIAMIVEPGPRDQPLVLVVRFAGEHGEVLARANVQSMTYLEFAVPAAPGTIAPLYFTPETPGSPCGPDARVLSFRVFAIGGGVHRSAASNSGVWLTMGIDSKPVTRDWTPRREPSPQLIEMGKPAHLHTNTCMDFTLMSRAHWLDVRGYPELDLPSSHLDAMFCYAAHHAGARQQVLKHPLEIYRVPPDEGPPEPAVCNSQLECTLRDDLLWLIANMRSLQAPVIFNKDAWGLGAQNLPETSPALLA